MFRSSIRSFLNIKSLVNQVKTRGEQTVTHLQSVDTSLAKGDTKSLSVREAIQCGPSEESVIVSVSREHS